MDYRFHTTIAAEPGLNAVPDNVCQVISFQLLVLEAGQTWSGSSGGREILAVVLGGRATFEVARQRFESVGGRDTVFTGKPHSVYIPAGAEVRVTAETDVEVAMPSAPSDLDVDPYVITPDQVRSGRWGAANFSREYHQILTETSQPDLPAARLIVGETFTPSGNWSTFPPHRHMHDNLPAEAQHEEGYYFKVNPADGFGIARLHTAEGYEENFTVRDHGMQMMNEGYHTVVSAPGCTTYYLWFLGGVGRTQAVIEDGAHAWVGATVPTLRSVGL